MKFHTFIFGLDLGHFKVFNAMRVPHVVLDVDDGDEFAADSTLDPRLPLPLGQCGRSGLFRCHHLRSLGHAVRLPSVLQLGPERHELHLAVLTLGVVGLGLVLLPHLVVGEAPAAEIALETEQLALALMDGANVRLESEVANERLIAEIALECPLRVLRVLGAHHVLLEAALCQAEVGAALQRAGVLGPILH